MFVLVNLKTYDCNPVEIATAAVDVADDSGVRIAVAPQAAHIERTAATGVETWTQHVAPTGYGSHTGRTLAATATDAGAVGTLLNHSERRLKLADIDAGIRQAEEAGLETIVCANNPAQIGAVTALAPDQVAVEPPELIGTGTPVSQADPDIVRDAVRTAERIDESVSVLCGAGISTGQDVVSARELGSKGVLLASGVAKAENPAEALADLVSQL